MNANLIFVFAVAGLVYVDGYCEMGNLARDGGGTDWDLWTNKHTSPMNNDYHEKMNMHVAFKECFGQLFGLADCDDDGKWDSYNHACEETIVLHKWHPTRAQPFKYRLNAYEWCTSRSWNREPVCNFDVVSVTSCDRDCFFWAKYIRDNPEYNWEWEEENQSGENLRFYREGATIRQYPPSANKPTIGELVYTYREGDFADDGACFDKYECTFQRTMRFGRKWTHSPCCDKSAVTFEQIGDDADEDCEDSCLNGPVCEGLEDCVLRADPYEFEVDENWHLLPGKSTVDVCGAFIDVTNLVCDDYLNERYLSGDTTLTTTNEPTTTQDAGRIDLGEYKKWEIPEPTTTKEITTQDPGPQPPTTTVLMPTPTPFICENCGSGLHPVPELPDPEQNGAMNILKAAPIQIALILATFFL